MEEAEKFFIVGADGRPYGPVDAATLQQWAREGRVVPSTQVRRDDDEAWWAAEVLPELAGVFSKSSAPPVIPQLAESPFPAMHEEWARDDYAVRVGAWLKRGWQIFRSDFLLIVSCFVLLVIVQIAASIALGIIPFGLGMVADFALRGVWVGGFFWFLLKSMRVRHLRQVSDIFAGFQRGWKALMTSQVLIMVFTVIANVPLLIAGVMFFYWLTGVDWNEIKSAFFSMLQAVPSPMGAGGVITTPFAGVENLVREAWETCFSRLQNDQFALLGWLIGLALLVLPAIVVGMFYMFTFPLIVDHRLGFWQAMETSRKVVAKHWFRLTTFAALCLPVINVAVAVTGFCVGFVPMLPWAITSTPVLILGVCLGVICMGIALMISLAYTACAQIAAYEDIFHKQRKNLMSGVDMPQVGG